MTDLKVDSEKEIEMINIVFFIYVMLRLVHCKMYFKEEVLIDTGLPYEFRKKNLRDGYSSSTGS